MEFEIVLTQPHNHDRLGCQAYLDHRANPTCLGFSTDPTRLGRRVRPIWLGSQVSSVHLGRRARFQIYYELKT